MIRAWAFTGFLALASVACGADDSGGSDSLSYVPVPGCEQFDYAPCDTMQTSCQTSRLELAACLRGVAPGELPPVTLWSESEYADALTARSSESPRPQPDHFERAFSLLHLVEPGAFQPAPLVMAQVERVWGFYDPETHGITLIDHGSPAADARSNVVLLHELVHALQDRDADLYTFGEELAVSSDASLALSSIVEGEARLHEDRYAASLSGLDPARVDWHEVFGRRIERGESWALAEPSPWLASRSVFPYDYGERFVDFAWQAGGHEAVLGLFAAPPVSSQVLMASTDAPSEPPQQAELLSPTPPEGWALVEDDVLGARSLLIALTRRGSAEQARPATLAWRGDLLAVYSRPSIPPETALVWQFELADEANATLVADKLGALLVGGRVQRLGTRVVAAAATTAISFDWAFAAP